MASLLYNAYFLNWYLIIRRMIVLHFAEWRQQPWSPIYQRERQTNDNPPTQRCVLQQ